MRRVRRRRRSSDTLAGTMVFIAFIIAVITEPCRPDRPSTTSGAPVDAPAPAGPPSSVMGFAWNVNRGVGAEPDASLSEIERLLARAGSFDVWAFSEVDPDWYDNIERALEQAAGAPVDGYLGETGRLQRLALFWRSDRHALLEVNELGRVNADGYGRAPIAALLREQGTGRQTLWVAVHFRRSNAEARAEEAQILGDLLRQLGHPTIVLGDANMDCPTDGGACDASFNLLVQNGFLRWVEPSVPLPTSCRRDGDMLDLAFIGGLPPGTYGAASIFEQSRWCTEAMGSGAHVPFSVQVGPRM